MTTETTNAVQIELSVNDEEAIGRLEKLGKDYVLFAEPDHFEGDVGVLSALVTIATATIPVIGYIVTEKIKSKKHVRVKYKGIEISGERLSNIEAFLKSIESDRQE